ncbi:BQ5605_C002g01688 [Microbotryum silenes-dioicae]|uniref:BQ5605_C002g01688 protein n=1 Tax=Microbotryum silenes-dioicae TaxID=796604 RepID=A0A2X0P281_9BASI|nr:BQ5605_C002g01688 [Microbotryum silenes-dioicae]
MTGMTGEFSRTYGSFSTARRKRSSYEPCYRQPLKCSSGMYGPKRVASINHKSGRSLALSQGGDRSVTQTASDQTIHRQLDLKPAQEPRVLPRIQGERIPSGNT